MSTLSFNGYRIDTPSGRGFTATVTNSSSGLDIPEGNYSILVRPDRNTKTFTYSFPRLHQTPTKAPASNTFALQSAQFPFKPLIKPAFIYDFGTTSSFGIQVNATFFSSTYMADAISKGKNVFLKINYAAPWMRTALLEAGEKEVKGQKANPRILEYFKSANFWGADDSGGANAWCASFVSWVMEQHHYLPPAAAYRAKAWAQFGKKVSAPVYGAIGIKSRQGGGHVAFVVGKSSDGKHLYMLGGNQGDEVNVSRYKRDLWDTFVMPEKYNAIKDTLPVYSRAAAQAGSES